MGNVKRLASKSMSSAMKDGAKKVPFIKGFLCRNSSACALGSALIGEFGTQGVEYDVESSLYQLIREAWPVANHGLAKEDLPVCRNPNHLAKGHSENGTLCDAQDRVGDTVETIIPYLNDGYHMTREEIAEWVEGIEKKYGYEDAPENKLKHMTNEEILATMLGDELPKPAQTMPTVDEILSEVAILKKSQ